MRDSYYSDLCSECKRKIKAMFTKNDDGKKDLNNYGKLPQVCDKCKEIMKSKIGKQ